jgi:large subunit ribosomal protein L9
MKVILLERVERLGALGDIVTVKDGFARNFLLPRSKALRANSANMKVFEGQRVEIENRNAKAREAAAKAGEKLDGSSYVMIRQAGDSGQLYGSVSGRDVADAVILTVNINIARSVDEAERQARGENVIASQFEEDRASDAQAAQDMLEGGAGSQETFGRDD